MKSYLYAFFALLLVSCGSSGQNDVGEINNDLTGNEIKIDSFEDEKVSGITCHIAHFDRSVIDRLRKGSWFENPSNGSINCEQTGPIVIGDIDRGKSGETLVKQKQALWFKTLSVRRVYDAEADTLIYLIYSKEVVEGSAKMSLSTVSLYGRDVTWKE
ncbi:CreA family protein [Litorimonas sp.]|uniref:CreA family protein n=1 Tax=Litorimonas sp. TaxID=1892381 RepID=UPI003A8A626C